MTGVAGVDVASDTPPSPTAFTDLTWNVCCTPLPRPVAVKEVSSLRSLPLSGAVGHLRPVRTPGDSTVVGAHTVLGTR